MVVVGVDLGAVERTGSDAHSVREFVDGGAQLAKFPRQITNSVGFLVSDVGDACDRRWTIGEQRDRAERLDGVADRIHVDRDAPESPACDRDPIRFMFDLATISSRQSTKWMSPWSASR